MNTAVPVSALAPTGLAGPRISASAAAQIVSAPPCTAAAVVVAGRVPRSRAFVERWPVSVSFGLIGGAGSGVYLGRGGWRRRRQWQSHGLGGATVVALTAVPRGLGSAGSADVDRDSSKGDRQQHLEEVILRLEMEISEALENNDLARAADAQSELREVHMEMPSGACRHLIREDCRAAIASLKSGSSIRVDDRIKAVKKLGRWLRWGRSRPARDLVPTADALGGLLCALRSEPEVAWAAQCSLFHAARCHDGRAQSVRDGPRGTLSRLLVNEPSPFPFVLPRLASKEAQAYERAFRTHVVSDFFSQLKALSLSDPGYGHEPHWQELSPLRSFSKLLGRNVSNLERLRLFGFEDSAMTLILPQLVVPNLKSLRLVGACQTAQGSKALLSLLRRVGHNLTELELNVWTEFLYEADDPLVELGPMPNVRKLTVRAPPDVAWEDFGRLFPKLEELTFLYHHDFAINSMECLEECSDFLDQREQLEEHTSWLYRDAVMFARDLHIRGFQKLANSCKNLKEICVAVADTSYGYDVTPPEDRLAIGWRRVEDSSAIFQRKPALNNQTRATLQAQSAEFPSGKQDEEEDYSEEAMEEEASAAAAAIMLQVIRKFDDPSIEASFGLKYR